jgi:hypothetical protein
MKHILPILTLTTLAAAASAQSAAAPAGLSYNRAGVNYNTDSAENGYSVSVEALIGSSNVWVGGTADLDSTGDDEVAVGYLFKNVAAGIDATVAVSSNDAYGLILRRSLNEVISGLEARFVWSHATGSDRQNAYLYELAYNIGAKYQVAVSLQDSDVANSDEELSFSVRYNF